jgi:hypothetical protein
MYSTLLTCPGTVKAYERLKQLRDSAHTARKAMAELVKNKQTIGPAVLLQESLKFKDLLAELHRYENTFAGMVQKEFQVVLDALVSTMNAPMTT